MTTALWRTQDDPREVTENELHMIANANRVN